MFASSVGTWMQNVALGAFAYRLTGRSSFGAILGLAQNGPQFILATVGGVLADTRDRVRLMQIMQTGMLVVCVVLTFEVRSASPSKLLLFWTVVALGACNALNGPVFNSLTPGLVPREHLPGVVALMSTQLNLSRVVGPALGGLLQPKIDVWGVFLLNSISYLAVIIVLSVVTIPPEARRVAQTDRRACQRSHRRVGLRWCGDGERRATPAAATRGRTQQRHEALARVIAVGAHHGCAFSKRTRAVLVVEEAHQPLMIEPRRKTEAAAASAAEHTRETQAGHGA